MSSNFRMYSLGAALVFAAGALSLAGCPSTESPQMQSPQSPERVSTDQVLERIKDAVVLVETTLQLPEGEIGGTGSGFVINNEGRIITNAHVISPVVTGDDGRSEVAVSREIRVIFHPGTDEERAYSAEVVREHPGIDLALLKIDAATPVWLELGDSAAIPQTAKVIACGHPLGLREISLRTGTVTAHRTFEGKQYLEHDAEADDGNSGGPVVDETGRVVGVHTATFMSENMSTKWAIPSNVLREWLRSDPANDPPVQMAAAGGGGSALASPAVEDLLDRSGLSYTRLDSGIFELPYSNEATVYVHEVDDLLRVYTIYGEITADDAALALRFTYNDPVGRFSVHKQDGNDVLYWEAQVPMGIASPDYLRDLADIAASQIENFDNVLSGREQLGTPTALYPGGDPDALYAELRTILDDSGLTYSDFDEETFEIPFENGVTVYAKIYRGVAYIHCYTGGVPGGDPSSARQFALELLQRNWYDPVGRLAMDEDYDVVWESQIPMTYLTPDYLYIVANIASTQVEDFLKKYGEIPFNANQ